MSETRKPLLIVEDDPALQVQMKWAFDAYEVAVASNREEAIAQLRHSEPAVVTLDLGLPPDSDGVSEGFKALGQILELAPDTKVIVLTGQNDVANALQRRFAGRSRFLRQTFRARSSVAHHRPRISHARASGRKSPPAGSAGGFDKRDHHRRARNVCAVPNGGEGLVDRRHSPASG